jgi:hypothetical protein
LVDVVAIDATATLMEFRNLWVKHQYSRYWWISYLERLCLWLWLVK